MRIGIDFDNTIVCYDELFWQVARERGLIPQDIPRTKDAVRDALRQSGREADWTEMQGLVYGTRMQEAREFPGVADFFRMAASRGWSLCIISHKTRLPYAGPPHDLHAAAGKWLRSHGFVGTAPGCVSDDAVFFALDKRQKLNGIGAQGCRAFIDDLPELLADPSFPARVERVLFDPHDRHVSWSAGQRFSDWAGATAVLDRLEPPHEH